MAITRPRAERGAFPPGAEQYGRSFLGASLIWFPAPDADRESGLILAGTHGDENSSIVTLSCALRTLTPFVVGQISRSISQLHFSMTMS